jgi:hypothetical protein
VISNLTPSSPPPGPELAFVLAPGQNLFFAELVDALRDELERANVRSSLHVGNFPEPRPDRVYVLTPPHEYFTLLYGRHGPLPEVLARTIFICAEQPNTPFFDNNLHLAPRGGAVFDINRFGVRAFMREGIVANHLQLGWTPSWDHLSEGERDIDVLFLGSHTERRARVIGTAARTFSRFRTEFVFSDNAKPNWAASESYHDETNKWDLISRAKIVLNVHQEDNPYFEWLRIVQAIINGAVVVSEHSVDYAPLVAGRDLLLGDSSSLGTLCALLLEDDDRRWRMQTAASRTVREQLPLSEGAARLARAASALSETEPIREVHHRFFTQPQPTLEEIQIINRPFAPPSDTGGDVNATWIRRALKDLRLEILQLRREQRSAMLEAQTGAPPPRIEQVAHTSVHFATRPRISVITALYNHADFVREALSSVAGSYDVELELIVVDDGSSDGSSAAVRAWMADHDAVSALLLRHPVNRGLAHARNDAIGMARGEYVFVLDADNVVYPRCLSRLQSALDDDPGAVFAYCTLEKFTGQESVGLMNILPWQPERLRAGNYIDAMSLLRVAAVREAGGYPTDARLHGWEDYALYCQLAERGGRGIRVPEILARYRVSRHSMLSLTSISSTAALSVIIEANPTLMAGVEVPD